MISYFKNGINKIYVKYKPILKFEKPQLKLINSCLSLIYFHSRAFLDRFRVYLEFPFRDERSPTFKIL